MLSSIDGCVGSIKEEHELPNSDWRGKPAIDMPTSQSQQLVHAKSRIMMTHAKARHEQPDEVNMHSSLIKLCSL